MGNSARRLVELLNIWDANRDNADEEFWQTILSSHAYAISQLFAIPATLIKEKAYVGGMTFERSDARLLRQFNYEIRSVEGRILVERAASE